MSTTKSAIQRAVDACGRSQSELARRLTVLLDRKITQRNVWNWLNRDKSLLPEYCIPIEAATGGAVTRHELRPDIYPPEPGEAPAADGTLKRERDGAALRSVGK